MPNPENAPLRQWAPLPIETDASRRREATLSDADRTEARALVDAMRAPGRVLMEGGRDYQLLAANEAKRFWSEATP